MQRARLARPGELAAASKKQALCSCSRTPDRLCQSRSTVVSVTHQRRCIPIGGSFTMTLQRLHPDSVPRTPFCITIGNLRQQRIRLNERIKRCTRFSISASVYPSIDAILSTSRGAQSTFWQTTVPLCTLGKVPRYSTLTATYRVRALSSAPANLNWSVCEDKLGLLGAAGALIAHLGLCDCLRGMVRVPQRPRHLFSPERARDNTKIELHPANPHSQVTGQCRPNHVLEMRELGWIHPGKSRHAL